MAQKLRLTGIDLFRGIAIFCVILLHSDEGLSTYPKGWTQILEFSSFAVPFFLATSFYLTFNKISKTGGQYFLRERLERLLVPYFVWTGLYVGYQVLKYLPQNDLSNVRQLFQDPIALIFFGGAAFQLYFLPLLAAGTILIKPLSLLIKQEVNTKILIGLLIFSLIIYETILLSGNSYQMSTGTAFQAWLNNPELLIFKNNPVSRVILTEMALIIKCLPYIFVALIFSKLEIGSFFHRKSKVFFAILWVLIFIATNIFGEYFLPQSLYELSQGFTALIAGIVLSNHLRINKIISSLSMASFGIYLNHIFFVEALQTVEARIYTRGIFRISTFNLLIFSLMVLTFSWIATDILMRKKSIAKILFGA